MADGAEPINLAREVATQVFGGIRAMSQETGIPESTIHHAIATRSERSSPALRLLFGVLYQLGISIQAENVRVIVAAARKSL